MAAARERRGGEEGGEWVQLTTSMLTTSYKDSKGG